MLRRAMSAREAHESNDRGRTFSHAAARRFYDRFGSLQDTQMFYEKAPFARLVSRMEFGAAHAVFEFGCGTGRFAADLLERYLPPDARYAGVDVSATMVRLTKKRLERFGTRAEMRLSDGAPRLDFPDASFDRFVSTYVLDILSPADVRAVLGEAHRVLVRGGHIGLISLTRGERGFARLLTSAWGRLWALSPTLVGGCRPINLTPYVESPDWTVEHDEIVTSFGVPSQIVIARANRS